MRHVVWPLFHYKFCQMQFGKGPEALSDSPIITSAVKFSSDLRASDKCDILWSTSMDERVTLKSAIYNGQTSGENFMTTC